MSCTAQNNSFTETQNGVSGGGCGCGPEIGGISRTLARSDAKARSLELEPGAFRVTSVIKYEGEDARYLTNIKKGIAAGRWVVPVHFKDIEISGVDYNPAKDQATANMRFTVKTEGILTAEALQAAALAAVGQPPEAETNFQKVEQFIDFGLTKALTIAAAIFTFFLATRKK